MSVYIHMVVDGLLKYLEKDFECDENSNPLIFALQKSFCRYDAYLLFHMF